LIRVYTAQTDMTCWQNVCASGTSECAVFALKNETT
jgi:hypothetical protein